MDAHEDSLLNQLIEKEKVLAERVAAAQQEAATIIKDAEGQAESILAEAESEGLKAKNAAQEAAAAEAETERSRILEGAKADAEAVQSRTEARKDAAVTTVMERLLP